MSTDEAAAGCRECETLLAAFVDGELDAPTAARMTQHLETCEPCRRAVEAERRLVESMRAQLQAIRMPAPLRSSLLARLRTESAAELRRRQSGG